MLSLQYSFLCLLLLVIFKPVYLIVISTPNGQIEGVQYQTGNNKAAYAFLGIRYAQPPLGNLRFRPPIPQPSWTGVYNATYQRNICIQPESNGTNITKENEDCLFLNVYTTYLPNTNITHTQNKSLPVLVWIHGGGFIFNSGNLELNGPDRFLDKDVLVVSINYRLGVFGFLCTEDNIVPGNYGLKDQILALQWIQKNIVAFGGDPKKVTIFGESAGAASVHYLRQSKRAQNLFHGTIANSGNTLNPWSIARNARTLAFRIGLINGILAFNSKTLVERLRTVDAIQLQRSSIAPALLDIFDPLNGLPFSPTIEVPSEEAVFTKISYEAQRDGNFNQGPLLHGFNSLEGANLIEIPWVARLLLEQYDLFPSRLTPIDMNTSEAGRNIVGGNIKSFYFHNQSVQTAPYFANYFSDNEFVRGIVKSTVLESAYSSVYLYRFSFHNFLTAYPGGVSHAEELPFLWILPGFSLASPGVRLTAERMVQMWTNFVKTGNPTPTLTPEVNVTWPLANSAGGDTVNYLDIGEEVVTKINPQQQEMAFWEYQYGVFGYPPYSTY